MKARLTQRRANRFGAELFIGLILRQVSRNAKAGDQGLYFGSIFGVASRAVSTPERLSHVRVR